MKYGVKSVARALFFITLLTATLLTAPGVSATDGGSSSSSSLSSSSSGSSSSGSSQPTPPPVDLMQLYRVRYGAEWRGEITTRFYIERNIALAETQGVVGDYDPDGDGWAIVGHTDENYDGKKYAGLSFIKILGVKYPVITLNWNNDAQCAALLPFSLDVVKPDEDRLLKVIPQRICFTPATNPQVTILPPPLEAPTQANDTPIQSVQEMESPSTLPEPPQQQSEPVQPQQTSDVQILEAIAQVPVPGLVDAASTDIPNYVDASGKNSAQIASQVGNSFLTAVAITVAILLGLALLLKVGRIILG